MTKEASYPQLGSGVGLRSPHYPVITSEWPRMDWFEAISENYMDTGGRPLHILEKVRQHYPLALHGTSISIGSADPLERGYLVRLKKLVERIDPFIVSDHLCWCGVSGEALHDLLPLPLTEEAIRHVVRRVIQVQEFLGRQILLENVSTYVTYKHSTIPEWEFLTEVVKRSGCGILLDLNNLYVNSFNHKFDPRVYLRALPAERIGQFHLAGHTDCGAFLFDTHSASVIDAVWELYREALKLYGPVSTLIEWDENIPDWPRLAEEAERARKIYREYNAGPVIASLPEIASASFGTLPRNDERISLPEAQRWMKMRIQPRERKSLRGEAPKAPIPSTLLNPQGGVPGEERMSVYAKGYLARIRETLREVYEAVHAILGEQKFSELSGGYANRFPSQNYNLNYAGRHLAKFLEESSLTKSYPFLPDLARLEWLIWGAFHAFDEAPLAPDQISGIALEEWENARLIFQPSVGIIRSDWPILDIWLERHKAPKEVKVDLSRGAQGILVTRKEDQVRCELIDEGRFTLLEELLAGQTLGEACERLAESTAESLPPVSEWFSRWIHEGLIRSCEFPAQKLISPRKPARSLAST